ncbi:hypothetical protein [Bradyrhizobium liaoningense]|uniref:hypothetical protein n=1 Tax=Bradyrhizobium liaoningense TaxID=43992 RepID=UPI001BA45AB0|nr:hypothetical protein [Bradyrhizobium liaoningense]MBR1033207.1 hypothetical protein [Bradyrhizobium liaoningense]
MPIAAQIKGVITPTSTIWISYDLGLRADYDGLFAWLAQHRAKECGASLAVLAFEWRESLLDELKSELSQHMAISKHDRIYVLYREKTSNKNKGRFIFGGRRAPSWTGYSTTNEVDEED